jgi:tetratricopeptide (TPR) repeat protein
VLFGAYWLTCQPERMRVEAEQVLAINPNDRGALGFIGTGLIYAGEADQGGQYVEKAIALAGPGAPTFWWGAIGDYHYQKGEYAEALDIFRKDYTESNWVDHMRLVVVLSNLGRIDEARAEIPAALRLRPDISVHEYDRHMKMFCLQRVLDSRAKCNRALREPDLHVFAKLFENCLKRSLEAKAFSGREIGGDDDVLDFLVGHFVDVDLTRQPAS